jgi:hypothetical protein
VATISKRDDQLVVKLWDIEKVEALHGGFELPIQSVTKVEAVENPISEVHGLRLSRSKLIGTYLPGETAVGVFLDDGLKQKPNFIAIHHNQKRGVRVTLKDAKYSELLIGCEDPEAIIELFS